MATPAQIAELRRLINQPTNVSPWTDEVLGERIDSFTGTDLRQLAASIWREKAASYAALVDVQEGNSSRKLSQLYKQANDMAEAIGGDADEEQVIRTRVSRTRQIERQ